MSDPDAYVMLISSLPRPEALFLSKRPPLSRLKLEQRLRMLVPEDLAVIRLGEQVLDWALLSAGDSDEQIVAHARATIEKIDNETVRLMIRDRLEIRTCVAALRRRYRGQPAPPADSRWGFGRWVRHIARNWSEPGFRLDRVFPWLVEADRLLRSGETMKLQRLVLEQVWKAVNRYGAAHEFDFEAVCVYVLKWSIVDRWVRADAEAAVARFEKLVQEGLGDFGGRFAVQGTATLETATSES
jgi:hypothetical protein